MLVLSKKIGEALAIGPCNARISVVALRDGVVRLGIEAPAGAPIFREESSRSRPRRSRPSIWYRWGRRLGRQALRLTILALIGWLLRRVTDH